MKKLIPLLILITTSLQALTISSREISQKENESQVRMYIQKDTEELNSNFKVFYYIKGENLKVIDNYTPNCSLYVEKLSNNISRIVLDYKINSDNYTEPLPNITPNTAGLMFTIYNEDGYFDRTECPSHIESNFFKINDSIDIVDNNGNVLYGDPKRVYRYIKFLISQNPVADILNVKYEGNKATYTFEIINSNLNTVKSWEDSFIGEQIETKQINISTLPSGVYTLRVKQFGNVVKVVQFYKDWYGCKRKTWCKRNCSNRR